MLAEQSKGNLQSNLRENDSDKGSKYGFPVDLRKNCLCFSTPGPPQIISRLSGVFASRDFRIWQEVALEGAHTGPCSGKLLPRDKMFMGLTWFLNHLLRPFSRYPESNDPDQLTLRLFPGSASAYS